LVENIYLKKFAFILKAEEDITLPGYKGSVFRGAFGWAFRHTVCVTKAADCTGCLLRDHCLYFKYFETEIKEHSLPFLKGVPKVPHPFVIHPPLDTKREYKKGSLIEVQLSLFGTASEYIPYFIHTFIKLGNEGLGISRQKVSLQKVESVSITDQRGLVFNAEGGKIVTTGDKITPYDLLSTTSITDTSNLRLKFLTPVRLQTDGKVVMNKSNITPGLLLKNIIRRYQAISYFYCGGSGENPLINGIDEIEVSENHLRFFEWSRYSSRQKTKMQMGGFVGGITLSNIPSTVIPYIYIGSMLGIGKHTVFGMGKYVIEQVPIVGEK
jgi:hypothetical protein